MDAVPARRLMLALHAAMERGLVRACHDLSEGGLAVAAAEMAFAGGLGMELDLTNVPRTDDVTRTDEVLFSESNSRFVVEVAPRNRAGFEEALAGLPFGLLGRVTADGRFRVRGLCGTPACAPGAGRPAPGCPARAPEGGGATPVVIDESIADLKEAWQAPLRW